MAEKRGDASLGRALRRGTIFLIALVSMSAASGHGMAQVCAVPLESACNANGVCDRGERCDTCSDCQPAGGCWAAPIPLPETVIHMSLLASGKVLWWGENATTYTFDPVTEVCSTPEQCGSGGMCDGTHLLCAGHSMLADGRLFVAGGHLPETEDPEDGIPDSFLYDPARAAWTRRADMRAGRWYPTVTTLPDGRVLVMEGTITQSVPNEISEVYDPRLNLWSQIFPSAPPNEQVRIAVWYPFNFVLPDGRVLYAGATEETRALDLAAYAWSTVIPGSAPGGNYYGSAAMYRPGMVFRLGGTVDTYFGEFPQSAAQILNMTAAAPTWVSVAAGASAPIPRAFHNLVLLPDGNALVMGGGTRSECCQPGQPGCGAYCAPYEAQCAVYRPERWTFARGDPANPSLVGFSLLNPNSEPRQYHSTALLLPDGRVLVAGGDVTGLPGEQASAEIFSPPYLTSGVARPVVTSVPASIAYGTYFDILTPTTGVIASVGLVRPGAVTHHFDENQRYVPLQFVRKVGYVRAIAPANSNVAPPGPYMIFIVNGSGVPSIGRFVQVGPTQPLGPVCDNDGTCEPAEDCSTCPNDCGSVSSTAMCSSCCGNDICETGEDILSCPADCVDSGTSMKVADVSLSCVPSGRSVKARARVSVVDVSTGAPVPNAYVFGQWTGVVTEGGSGLTDPSGWATMTTYNGRRPPAVFRFSVTDIWHATYGYQPLLNVESGGEITCGP